jgi:NADPH-dependent ferric siderophore reductase
MLPSKDRRLHEAHVINVADVTPRMRRVTVMGEGLRHLPLDHPGQWMKVFFPIPSGMRPQGRAYTIRAYDAVQGLMVFDFVLHGEHGPAAYWIARAKAGDVLQLGGPRAGYRIPPNGLDHVLIGDATALPAIAGIVAKLSCGMRAQVFVEVADAAEQQALETHADVDIHWLWAGSAFPGTTGQLELAVQRASLPTAPHVFLAGESLMVRALRTHLLVDRAIPRASIDAKGYWQLGAADHRDNR